MVNAVNDVLRSDVLIVIFIYPRFIVFITIQRPAVSAGGPRPRDSCRHPEYSAPAAATALMQLPASWFSP